MRKKALQSLALCAVGAILLLPSCVEVNDDYDLNKDIDMTIGAGGDLTLPTSNTVKLKMKDILDLEEDGIVQAVGEDSIYYLIEGADKPSTFEFELPTIKVDDPTLDPFEMSFTVPSLETLLGSFNLSETVKQQILANKDNLALLETFLGDEATIIRESPEIELDRGFNVLNYKFEVPEQVIGLDYIDFSAHPMQPDFDLTTTMPAGKLVLHNVNAEFPAMLNHDNVTFGGSWLGHLNEHGLHQYNVPDVELENGDHTRLELEFIGIDLKSRPEPENRPWERADHPDGILSIGEEVAMHGTVTVKGTILDFVDLAGETFKMIATIKMKAPQIDKVTVKVDPEINPESTTIELNDLPDFLTENDVRVILQQPTIRLDVMAEDVSTHEALPVLVECWGALETDKGVTVHLGNEAEPKIQIGGEVNSSWCIWDGISQPEWGSEYSYYQAENLTHIIEEIPNRIDLSFDARVKQEYLTIALGTSYKATIDYNVECPLALAEGSQIVYSETVEDLGADLDGIEVKGLKITALLLVQDKDGGNSIPFDELDLVVKPLDKNGNPVEGIVVEPLIGKSSGEIIELYLTCEKGAIENLDALTFEVACRVTNNEAAPLSANTTVQLTNVTIGIEGGVIADLN